MFLFQNIIHLIFICRILRSFGLILTKCCQTLVATSPEIKDISSPLTIISVSYHDLYNWSTADLLFDEKKKKRRKRRKRKRKESKLKRKRRRRKVQMAMKKKEALGEKGVQRLINRTRCNYPCKNDHEMTK